MQKPSKKFTEVQSIPKTEHDNRLDVSIDQVEKGTTINKALSFIMPNAWLNRIEPVFVIGAVFAPIDEHNTALYLSTHQKFRPLPIIGNWMASILNLYNKKVLAEDQRIVESQRPRIAGPQDEILIQPDTPIAIYRRMHQKRCKPSSQQPQD